MFTIVRKATYVILGVGAFGFGAVPSASAQNCSVSDFLIGSPGIVANACISGRDFVWDIEGEVKDWQGDDLSLLGLNVDTFFGDIDLGIDVDNLAGSGFQWEITNPSELDGIQDAVFVVQQGNVFTSGFTNWENDGITWVAYLVENINDSFGTFFTENSFNTNDYDILAVYGREGGGSVPIQSVPEIDAASFGISLSLLLSLVALIRERRFVRSRRGRPQQ